MPLSSSSYHHGDLYQTLIREAEALLTEGGAEALSLRKLAERAGVSRTAAYHHFKDKHDLLVAVAERGFEQLNAMLMGEHNDGPWVAPLDRLSGAVAAYIDFALNHAARYELMFGSAFWRQEPDERLQRRARESFRFYAGLLVALHESGHLSRQEDPLRLAQVMWASVHGLVKLAHDGILVRTSDLHDIARYAVLRLLEGATGPFSVLPESTPA